MSTESFEIGRRGLVSEGLEMTGNLCFTRPGTFSGRIKGSLSSDHKIVVTKEGVINGEVHASRCEVYGNVKGTLHINGLLYVPADGTVDGIIRSQALEIDQGANVKAIFDIGGGEEKLNSRIRNFFYNFFRKKNV